MTRAMLALSVFAGLAAAVGPPRPRLDVHGDALPPGAVARLGSARWRTQGSVAQLAFSPDGKWVAAAAGDGLYVFGADGRPAPWPQPRTERASRVAFSPDGKRLAVDQPRAVRIYALPSGRVVEETDNTGLQWLGWSADGRPLGVFHGKGAVLLRDLGSGKEQRIEGDDLPGPDRGLTGYAYAAEGKLLAVPDKGGRIRVWDAVAGQTRRALRPRYPSVPKLAFSPDGRRLATLSVDADKKAIELWDLATGKATPLTADQRYPLGVAFSPDGKALATVGWVEVRIWDATTGKERCRFKRGDYAPIAAFSPDGKTLVTARHRGGVIQLWDAATGAARPGLAGHEGPSWGGFSPDGRHVLSGSRDGTLILWDAVRAKPLRRFADDRADLLTGRYAPDGRLLLYRWAGEALTCSDAETGKERLALKTTDPDQPKLRQRPSSVRLSADGRTLVTVSQVRSPEGDDLDASLLTGWDAATGQPRFRRLIHNSWFEISPDATVLATAADAPPGDLGVFGAGPLPLVDLATGQRIMSLPYVKTQTRPLAFSPNGRLLATSTFSVDPPPPGKALGQIRRTLRLWELASAGEVLALPTTMNGRTAFTADGATLALTAPGDEVVLWDLRRGRERQRLRTPGPAVHSVAFSPDGTRLATGLANTTILIWDIAGPKRAAHRLDANALANAWDDLAGDPKAAFAARGTLALAPADAVPLLAKHLKPVPRPDAAAVKRHIAELDSDTYATREAARRELEQLGDAVAGALRQALKAKPSLEAYRRLEALLKRQSWLLTDRAALRQLRGVAVLEDIGDAASVKHLKALAAGAAAARLTEDAKAALARLARRPAARP